MIWQDYIKLWNQSESALENKSSSCPRDSIQFPNNLQPCQKRHKLSHFHHFHTRYINLHGEATIDGTLPTEIALKVQKLHRALSRKWRFQSLLTLHSPLTRDRRWFQGWHTSLLAWHEFSFERSVLNILETRILDSVVQLSKKQQICEFLTWSCFAKKKHAISLKYSFFAMFEWLSSIVSALHLLS